MDQSLEEEFKAGTQPKDLDGFYKGELTRLLPGRLIETLGGTLFQLWLPWRGKAFFKETHMGDNVLPSLLAPLFRLYFKKEYSVKNNSFHAFPFKTSVQKSLMGKHTVLQLNYNVPQNPSRVREVIDELIEGENNTYLGKAYIIENKTPRLVAFFRLKKD